MKSQISKLFISLLLCISLISTSVMVGAVNSQPVPASAANSIIAEFNGDTGQLTIIGTDMKYALPHLIKVFRGFVPVYIFNSSITPSGGSFTMQTSSFQLQPGVVYTLQVEIVNPPPYATWTGGNVGWSFANPTITTTQLEIANGMVGVPYNQTLVAGNIDGRSMPMEWRYTALPPGLSLNYVTGVISGIPTVAGNFNFTVRFGNDAANYSRNFSITIGDTAQVPITHTVTINNGGVGAAVTGGAHHEAGYAVTVNAGTRTGFTFTGWTFSPSVNFVVGNTAVSSITRFVMPAGNVTATANWQQTSTSNGSGPGIGSDAGPGFPGGWTGGGGGGTTGTATAAEGVTPPAVLGYTPFIEEHIAYISGFPDGTFRPSQAITRAEVSMILFRLLDSNAKYSPQANHFSDVQAGRWYAQAINYLAGRNILAGEHNGTFRPNDSMTRAELAAVMSRFFELGESGMSSFYDVNANHWAFRYIMNAEGRGWVSGYDDRTFRPNNAIIRAEAVTLINRVLNRNPNPATIREHLAGVTVFTDITQGHWAFYQVMEASISHEFEIDANGLEIWTYIVSLPNSN